MAGSRAVTVTGSDRHGVHGAYGDACVDGTVDAYLRTGKLPGADVTCAAAGRTGTAVSPAEGGESAAPTTLSARGHD
ncbi:alpha/beta hydrolase [Streptomyces sp. NPDC058295]|uniref:alpha/beta hydrolase n=1 Tax=Streptomyces sp. NPDC058295 TaxID=3346431 RepID=UPI0036EB6791